MQHLNEVVQGIQQRREELNTGVVQQQTELQEIVQGVGTDSAAIQRQLDQIVPVSDGLEETARAQQELINRLQQELQRKQLAFEEAQRQLAESDARLKEASKELVETRKEITASKSELTQVREELIAIAEENKEKNTQIATLDNTVNTMSIQAAESHSRLKKAAARIEELSTGKEELSKKLDEANALIETLTEQLEEAQENKRGRSPSPSFFK